MLEKVKRPMQYKNLKVTIGICVKNCEATIREAIYSVLKQNFPLNNIEIILVDGGSTDKTLLFAKNVLSKHNVDYRIFTENKGLGYARQIVADNARGDYIVWVDGDLILSHDHVRKSVEFMEKNKEFGIAAGTHQLLSESNIIAALEDVPYEVVDLVCRGEIHSSSRLPGTAGSIYRVKAIRQVGGFDADLNGVGEDIEVAYRMLIYGWRIYRGIDATFYERRPSTWKDLWNHYVWYGEGAYKVNCRRKGVIKLYKLIPLAGFFAGVWYSTIAYKLKGRKCFFLLPFHYAFKRTAWFLGFIKAYLNNKRRIKNNAV